MRMSVIFGCHRKKIWEMFMCLVDMIIDNEPVVSKFISVPKDLQNNLNCASFVAGIVGAIMQSALFVTFFALDCCRSNDD